MFDLSVIRAAQCLNPLKWKLLEKILRCTEVRTWTCLIFRQFRTLSTREAYREEEPSASDQASLEDGFRWFQMVSDGFRWFQMVSDGFRVVGRVLV